MLDQLLDRGVISSDIPDIRRQAVEIFYRPYKTQEAALNSIAGLKGYYEHYYPDYYAENADLVQDAIVALQDAYAESVYPEQKSDWDSHPNNLGHIYSPGCFRCHDGKHLNEEQKAIRLECNICHSIPVVSGESDFVTNLQISRGPEPESHLNSNWISMHRDVFDQTCQNCHTAEDPGGTSNTSFCSNSACHGSVYEYAGFNAPALRKIILEQLPEPEPPAAEIEITEDEPITYENIVGPLLIQRCGSCHGENPMVGLDLTSSESVIAGSDNGPVIVPGDPAGSRLIQIQTGEKPHFGQFSIEELDLIIEWIETGAPK
jgi:mono/diheme cytochrome c family protein